MNFKKKNNKRLWEKALGKWDRERRKVFYAIYFFILKHFFEADEYIICSKIKINMNNYDQYLNKGYNNDKEPLLSN